MIRKATISDLVNCKELAAGFFQQKNPMGRFAADAFLKFWESVLTSGCGEIFLRLSEGRPVEAIGIILHPSPDNGCPCASSMFWFFTDGPQGLASGALFHHVMETLDERNIPERRIPVLPDAGSEKARSFLLGNGFRKEHEVFLKEVI